MIEGINASLANAALVRPVTDMAAEVASYASNPGQVQRIAQAPYVSPYISMNYTYDKAVLQIRDSDSGEVVRQIPTDTQLRAYTRASQSAQVIQPKEDPIDRKVEAQARGDSPAQVAEATKGASPAAVDVPSSSTEGSGEDTATSVLISA